MSVDIILLADFQIHTRKEHESQQNIINHQY